MQGGADLEGKEHSLRFSGALGNGWDIEASHLDFDNRPDEQRVKLTYRVQMGGNQASHSSNEHLISQKIFEEQTMERERLSEVRRSNTVTKQTGTIIRYRGT